VASCSKFSAGNTIMARYAIYARDITNLTLQSNTIYTSWCMDFVTLGVKLLN